MKKIIVFLLTSLIIIQTIAQSDLNSFENIANTIVLQSITNPYVLVIAQKTSTEFCTNQAAKEYYSPLYNIVESQYLDDYYFMDEAIFDSEDFWLREIYNNVEFQFFPSLKKSKNPVFIRMYGLDMIPFMELKFIPNNKKSDDFTFEWYFTGKSKHYSWIFTDNIPIEIIEYDHFKITEKFINTINDGLITETQRLDMDYSNHKKILYEYSDSKLTKKEVFQRKESGKYKQKLYLQIEQDIITKTSKLVRYNSNDKPIEHIQYVINSIGNPIRITKFPRGNKKPITLDLKYDETNKVVERIFNKYSPNIKTIKYDYHNNGLVKSIAINQKYVNSDSNHRTEIYYQNDHNPFLIKYIKINEEAKEHIVYELVFNYDENGNILNLRKYDDSGLAPIVSLITFEYFELMEE